MMVIHVLNVLKFNIYYYFIPFSLVLSNQKYKTISSIDFMGGAVVKVVGTFNNVYMHH